MLGESGLEEEVKYPGLAAPPQCTPELASLEDDSDVRRLPGPVWTDDELMQKMKMKNPLQAKMDREFVRHSNSSLRIMF